MLEFLKGWLGEFEINLASKLFLNSSDYHLMRNVTILTEGGGTTQIDHIIVSRYGVFVVETKKMKGWIFGSERDPMWTVKLFNETHRFQNPLRQNYKHMKILASLLALPEVKMKSVIVFVGDSTFKTPMPENVLEIGHYLRYIESHRQVILSEFEVQDIIQRIKNKRLTPGLRTYFRHVQNVQDIVEQKEQQNLARRAHDFRQAREYRQIAADCSQPHCPRCGKPMRLRTSKQGATCGQQFWGCTGFPQCRGTLPYDREQ